MKNIYKLIYLKNQTYFLILIICFFSLTSNLLQCQDLFGKIPLSPTSYVTKSNVAPNGNIFITVWGSGVFRSADKGKTWTAVSNGLTNLNVTDIEFISASEIIVATMGSGIFKSNSLTTINWVQINQGLENLNVKSLRIHPNGWVFAGTYGSGIFQSKDKGANWTKTGKGLLYKDVSAIEVADNGWLVAGTYGGGIFISRDTSKTWTLQSASMKNQFINDIKRNKLGYLYAASNGRGVYMSVNDGIAWTELDTFMTRPLKVNPVPLPDLNTTSITFNKLMSPVFGSRYGGIYAEDKEEDFTWIPTRLRGVGVNTMCQNADSMYSFFPNYPPHSSNNVGEEWTELEKEPLATLGKSTKVLTLKEKELIAYYGSTVNRSTDDGKTWMMQASTPYKIYKIARDSSGNFYAATDSGLYVSDPAISSWSFVYAADTYVYDVEVAPNGTKYIVAQYYKNMPPPADPIDERYVAYSTDGVNWIKAPITFNKFDSPPQDIGVNYNNYAYVGSGDRALCTVNNGVSWTLSSSFPSLVKCFGFLKNNSVLVGTSGSGLFISSNLSNFQQIAGYPASSISVLYADKNDYIYASGKNVLIDAAFGYVEASYMSKDSGKTFININKDFNGEEVNIFSGNNSGDLYMSTASGMIYRAIDSTNLSIPKLVSLPDKTYDVETDAQFTWTTAKRAELYQLQISFNDEFSYAWEHVTQLDTVHNLVSKLEPNHKYFWRVRSKNHSAVSPWSEVRSFTSKLKTPTLISPANKEINVPVYANLVWEEIDGAANYKIQISKKADMSVLAFELNTSEKNITTPLLEGLTEYFWRVKANNSVSTSNWSEIWSFKTVFGPPLLMSPADSSTGNAKNQLMVWQNAINITEYDIQISDKKDFSTLVTDKSAVAATSVLSDDLEYDKIYYWRVRSRNGSVTSEWSLVWSFRTGYSPVVLLSPENNAVNVIIKTIFNWEKHPTQNKYEIEVAKSQDFSNNVIFEPVNNLLTFTASNLEAYQEYYWRVRVISDSNTGVWSAPFKYKTQVDKIGLRFPGNQTENHPLTVNFLWFATKGAVKYHLQIANDNEFNDLVFSQDTISNVSHNYPSLNPGSEYFWRVRAVSTEGVGEWSEVWKFKTGNNIPVLILPANGDDKVVNPIKFQWAPVGGALKFELQVSENETFAPNVFEKNDITDNQFIKDLEFPKTYFWKIRAITDEGPTNWSQVWTFTTKDPSGVKDIITLSETEIYPNPADKSVQIKLSESVNSDIHLKILDMSGKTVFSEIIIPNGNILNFDCSGLNSGLYFFMLQSSDKIFKGEIIINR